MLPLRDENPHPPGFKPKITIALIIINVIVFGIEVAITGQFIEFSNYEAMNMFLNWGAVPGCVTGQIDGINTGAEIINCPAIPELTLITSTFMHGGIMHLGGNMLFLWIFGDNIEAKFGKIKYIGIYLMWGVGAGLIHIYGDAGSGIPAVGASGAIAGILGAYLVMFPRAKVMTFVMLGIFLAYDAHSCKILLTILVNLSKFVTIFCRWLWCCRWWCCIFGTHWWFLFRIRRWLFL